MANTILKLTTILFLLISLALQNAMLVSSNDDIDNDIEYEEEEDYVLDTPLPHLGSRSRVLTTIIKKGTHCDRETNNICDGVRANKGRDKLFCCKKHCRNVLSDKNNCGVCGHKCNEGERCCGGVCTNILSDVHNCGKCKKECSLEVECVNGFCGYA